MIRATAPHRAMSLSPILNDSLAMLPRTRYDFTTLSLQHVLVVERHKGTFLQFQTEVCFSAFVLMHDFRLLRVESEGLVVMVVVDG